MQVFIVGTPFETARALDKRRLNKQIIECQQILDALNGAKAWSNHPCVLQYRGHKDWLRNYMDCLDLCSNGCVAEARFVSFLCDQARPPFHTEDFFNQMKRRLYTKDNNHYAQWAHLGESEDNWYFVDNEWKVYNNGKRIE